MMLPFYSFRNILWNMEHDKLLAITIGRIRSFIDAMSTNAPYQGKRCAPMSLHVYSPKHSAIEPRPLFHQVMADAEWGECKVGDSFGPPWSTHWFRVVLEPMKDWNHDAELHFLWNSKYVCHSLHAPSIVLAHFALKLRSDSVE